MSSESRHGCLSQSAYQDIWGTPQRSDSLSSRRATIPKEASKFPHDLKETTEQDWDNLSSWALNSDATPHHRLDHHSTCSATTSSAGADTPSISATTPSSISIPQCSPALGTEHIDQDATFSNQESRTLSFFTKMDGKRVYDHRNAATDCSQYLNTVQHAHLQNLSGPLKEGISDSGSRFIAQTTNTGPESDENTLHQLFPELFDLDDPSQYPRGDSRWGKDSNDKSSTALSNRVACTWPGCEYDFSRRADLRRHVENVYLILIDDISVMSILLITLAYADSLQRKSLHVLVLSESFREEGYSTEVSSPS